MADPQVQRHQLTRPDQEGYDEDDPVTGEQHITGSPRTAVDLRQTPLLTDWDQ